MPLLAGRVGAVGALRVVTLRRLHISSDLSSIVATKCFDRDRSNPYYGAPMLTRRIPATVEPYRLAANHELLEGTVDLESLSRLAAEIGSQSGQAQVSLQFGRDAQRRHLIEGELSAQLQIPCRRCLQPMSVPVSSRFQLAVVSSDALASEVPSEYEPVLVDNEHLDLLEAIEDELLLSLPQVVYHEEAECAVSRDQMQSGESADEQVPARADSPFDVLKTLKGKL